MMCLLIRQKKGKRQHVSSAKIFPPHHRSSFWILIILHRWKRNPMFICGRFLVANPNLNLYLPLLGGGVDKITTMKIGNPDVRKKSLATQGLLTLRCQKGRFWSYETKHFRTNLVGRTCNILYVWWCNEYHFYDIYIHHHHIAYMVEYHKYILWNI